MPTIEGERSADQILSGGLLTERACDMTFAINVLGWIGAAVLLSAYWRVSTQKTTGHSRMYQGMNLLGATLVLMNSLDYGAHPSVAVNAAWIAIGAYTLAKHVSLEPSTRPRTSADETGAELTTSIVENGKRLLTEVGDRSPR